MARHDVGVAIVTRDRRSHAVATVARIRALPEAPPVVVADNGSRDGTAGALRVRFRDDGAVVVLELGRNLGAAARTVAARRLTTSYVAFSDDDSWWDPGALTRAAALLDRHPRLGLVAARVLVGRERREDPTCARMRASPLAAPGDASAEPGDEWAAGDGAAGGPDVPGVPVLGFVACGAVVRREALLAVGGFHPRYGVGGEEALLALDLAAAGWQVRYVADVVAHHRPPPRGPADADARRATVVRNDLWTIWLRRPVGRALVASGRRLRAAGRRRSTAVGALAALAGVPWVARERRPLPAEVERQQRLLEA